ncbi:MAG: C-terminal helicase domain-containing protein, partial [Hyphomicrobium sp.]
AAQVLRDAARTFPEDIELRRHLARRLARAQQEKRLPGLEGFVIPGQAANRVATVHGFQGGEADVVVVSLVRNNARSVLGGVGFLSDRPLLNVMLSRAKRKLILVGSWAFFQKRVSEEALADKRHPLHPIARVFRELDRLQRAGQIGLVSWQGKVKR